MQHRPPLIITIFTTVIFALFHTGANAEAPKPHIVHIVADDLGWKDVGFHGAVDLKTPNLDRLAKSGVSLDRFYVQPMCTPTRAALMTGRYPFRYGLQTVVIPSKGTYGLDTKEYTLPQVLKDGGYRTAMVGKWHLGHADRKYWPCQRGFDYHYGAVIGEIDYFTRSAHDVIDSQRNNQTVHEEGYVTQLLGADAVKQIQNHDASIPLYLYLAFTAPHAPYQAPPEYLKRHSDIADETRRAYVGKIECMDDEIGKVVAALAGSPTTKCKPLDGLNVWPAIAEGKSSERDEVIYNVEPFRGAVRQGDWKLVWRCILPSSVELFNVANAPNETTDLSSQHPEKVKTLQARLEQLSKESAKPLFMETAMSAVFSGIFGPAPIPTEDASSTAEP